MIFWCSSLCRRQYRISLSNVFVWVSVLLVIRFMFKFIMMFLLMRLFETWSRSFEGSPRSELWCEELTHTHYYIKASNPCFKGAAIFLKANLSIGQWPQVIFCDFLHNNRGQSALQSKKKHSSPPWHVMFIKTSPHVTAIEREALGV